MRVPLDSYIRGKEPKVFSLVATFPFSPLDIDVGRLARGEWNPATDRFRIWNLPGDDIDGGLPLCHVMVRKFDPKDLVLVYAHANINIEVKTRSKGAGTFTVGIMSNDDVRARSTLNTMFEIPPAFHKRSEVQLVERKWRADSDAVMRFLANVQSVMIPPDRGGRVYGVRFEIPSNVKGDFRRGLEGWW